VLFQEKQVNIWTQNDSVEKALELPKGRYAANFGFWVEQSVNPEYVLIASQSIVDNKIQCTVASQAGLIVKAQQAGVAFSDWAELRVM
jgi:hypothetical protein